MFDFQGPLLSQGHKRYGRNTIVGNLSMCGKEQRLIIFNLIIYFENCIRIAFCLRIVWVENNRNPHHNDF